jgi:hypothetical protein
MAPAAQLTWQEKDKRFRVFLSYSTADDALVCRLRDHLQEDDRINCFYAPRSIQPNDYWRPKLIDEIKACNLFLLLYTNASASSTYVQWELDSAIEAKREVWIVEDTSTRLTPAFEGRSFSKRQTYLIHSGGETECFGQVRDDIAANYLKSHALVTDDLKTACPYPGPTTFQGDHFRKYFFGRQTTIDALTREIGGRNPVVLVHGPSGAGKSSVLEVGLIGGMEENWHYSGRVIAGPESTVNSLLLAALAKLLPCAPDPGFSSEQAVRALAAEINQLPNNRVIFCFDQMETFFCGKDATLEATRDFLHLLRRLVNLGSPKAVRFLISFRKEFYTDIRPRIAEAFEPNGAREWSEVGILKFSPADAKTTIIKPAAECGVLFDGNLAEELVAALTTEDHGGPPTVSPIDVQKVCKRLWERITEKTKGSFCEIDQRTLAWVLNSKDALDENARRFVRQTQKDYLDEEITKIAAKLSAEVAGPDRENYVRLALIEVFVGRDNVRERVAEKARMVGRLPLEVVEQLVSSGLVIHSGSRQYELAHDSLAEELARKGESIQEVAAVRSLDSVLTRERRAGDRQLRVFNQHSELLEQLESIRNNKRLFNAQEAEFILCCALGDKRKNVKNTEITLEPWVDLLRRPETAHLLLEILVDGLSPKSSPAVQLDILNLLVTDSLKCRQAEKNDGERRLTEPGHTADFGPLLWIRQIVLANPVEIGNRIRALALDPDSHDEVRNRACSALVAVGLENQIEELFHGLEVRDSGPRSQARTALGLVRHAIDTRLGKGQPFPQKWRSLHSWTKARILGRLCRWRWKQTYAWMFYITCLAAFLAAIGATLPFMVAGPLGASLTIGTRQAGLPVGIFHGVCGGFVWGLGVTLGLLFYCVLWRGGRIRQGWWETLWVSVFSMAGGFLGGLGNAAILALVFEPQGLREAGWLDPVYSPSPYADYPTIYRIKDLLFTNFHGWVMPLFGAALGLGIGWSLSKIISDPSEGWRSNFTAHGARATFATLARKVFAHSWRNALCLAAAAGILCWILVPGDGVCDPSAHIGHAGRAYHKVEPNSDRVPPRVLPSEGCTFKAALPSLPVRSAGLAIVIFGGCIGQEIAFLFGLLCVSFGVNLRPNPQFLGAANSIEPTRTVSTWGTT